MAYLLTSLHRVGNAAETPVQGRRCWQLRASAWGSSSTRFNSCTTPEKGRGNFWSRRMRVQPLYRLRLFCWAHVRSSLVIPSFPKAADPTRQRPPRNVCMPLRFRARHRSAFFPSTARHSSRPKHRHFTKVQLASWFVSPLCFLESNSAHECGGTRQGVLLDLATVGVAGGLVHRLSSLAHTRSSNLPERLTVCCAFEKKKRT